MSQSSQKVRPTLDDYLARNKDEVDEVSGRGESALDEANRKYRAQLDAEREAKLKSKSKTLPTLNQHHHHHSGAGAGSGDHHHHHQGNEGEEA
jgi:hypothetical protein